MRNNFDRITATGRKAAHGRGFTLLELLVVAGLIALLIAIAIPAIGHFKDRAKRAAVTNQLSGLQSALENYYQQFNVYPDSGNGIGTGWAGAILNGRGPNFLTEGLMGYLPAANDGAGTGIATDTSPYGFRTSGTGINARGTPYGPYGPDDKSLVDNNPTGTPVRMDMSFHDIYGNEILYFKSARSGTSTTGLPPIKFVFATDANSDYYFYTDDNAMLPETGTTPGTHRLDAAGANATPTNAAFLKLLGASNNDISASSGTILGSSSYILISQGPDGIAFSSDDIVVGGK